MEEKLKDWGEELYTAFIRSIEERARINLPKKSGDYTSEVSKLSSLRSDLLDNQEGFSDGELVGWRGVERLYRPSKGQWTVVTGLPSHGKTSWVDSMILNLAIRSKWQIALFSAENHPVLRHAMWLLSKQAGKTRNDMVDSEIDHCLELIGDQLFLVHPAENHMDLDSLLDIALSIKQNHGLDGLVLDPFNEIDHTGRKSYETETEYISKALSKIRRFSRDQDIHIWVVAHPHKMIRDKDGNYPMPKLYEISGSAAWRAKADNGIVVWRDMAKDPNSVTIYVEKIRYPENGTPGQTKLTYSPKTRQFSDV